MRERGALIVIGLLTLSFLAGGTLQSGTADGLTPKIEWERTYGGNGSDWGKAVQQTSDGGYIIAGGTTSYGAGGSDVWLLKTDASGTLEWEQTYGRSSDDAAWSTQQTSDGGYLLVGYARSSESFDYKLWVVKVTSTGELQWTRTFLKVQALEASGHQTRDGGYVITGRYGGHFWLGRLDRNGMMEWNQTLPREGYGTPNEVVQTADGGYLVVGSHWLPIDQIPADVRAVKLDATGQVEWDLTYGGDLNEQWEAVQQTPDQGYIVAGSTNSYSGDLPGNRDFWLVKLTASGTLQWQQTFGGDTIDFAKDVEQTTDGGYILAGTIWPDNPQPNGSTSAWLVKTDFEGNREWDLLFNETRRDAAHAICQTRDGGYIVVGSTDPAGKGLDGWLIKLKPPISTLLTSTLKMFWWAVPVGVLLVVFLLRPVLKKLQHP